MFKITLIIFVEWYAFSMVLVSWKNTSRKYEINPLIASVALI